MRLNERSDIGADIRQEGDANHQFSDRMCCLFGHIYEIDGPVYYPDVIQGEPQGLARLLRRGRFFLLQQIGEIIGEVLDYG